MNKKARGIIFLCLLSVLVITVLLLFSRVLRTGQGHASARNALIIAGDYNGRPYYWKDGRPFELSDYPGRALGAAVSGDSVYISGYIVRDSKAQACYWADGEFKPLELDGTYRGSYANSIAVYNGVVYTAGYFNDGVSDRACFWADGKKTNARTELPSSPGETNIHANGIGINAGKLQISGYSTRNGRSGAFRWNQGDTAKTPLPSVSGAAAASAAFTLKSRDNSVYIAGYYDGGAGETACYWENGVKNNLPPAPGERGSYAYGVAVKSGGAKDRAVYLTGEFYTETGPPAAFFWKTGDAEKTVLSAPGGRGVDIAVLGDSVYICGYEDDGAGKFPPCYWEIREDPKNPGMPNITKTALADSDIPAAALAITAAGK